MMQRPIGLEDALSQGRDRLQQILVETVAAGQVVDGTYIPQMAIAVEKLEALVSFVNQVMNLTFFSLSFSSYAISQAQFKQNCPFPTCL